VALGLWAYWEPAGGGGSPGWGGVAAGAGLLLKPQAVLFWAAGAVVVTMGSRPASALRGLALWCVAGLAVPVLVMGWLALRGGFGPFLSLAGGYVLPLYSRVGRGAVWEGLRWHVWGWQIWACMIALGLLGLTRRVPEPYGVRRGLALLGAGYGVLHYVQQGKGWEYHLYPFAVFLCALASAPLAALS